MGRHAAVLEKAAPQINLFSQTSLEGNTALAVPTAKVLASEDVFDRLAASLFRTTVGRSVVAFTSVQPGEGVTYVLRGLAAALNRSGQSVAVLDGALSPLSFDGLPAVEETFLGRPAIVGIPFEAEPKNASQTLAGLRNRYECILLDCGALKSSAAVTRVSSLCDGVVIVVEASRASKRHVDRAAQIIRQAQGTLLGLVFNKRRYPIPAWLYQLL
jgi:Mrp family chromosome partitioning ATPase